MASGLTRKTTWRAKVLKTKNISARGGHGMVQYGSKIFVFGGAKKDGDLNEVFEVDVDSLSENTVVAKLLPLSSFPSLYEFASVISGNKVWIFGGADKETSKNDLYVCDLEHVDLAVEMKTIAGQVDEPSPRTQYGNKALLEASAEIGEPNALSLAVFGGGCKEDMAVDDSNLYLLNLETNTWAKVDTKGTPPEPRQGHVMIVIGDRLFIHGGLGSNQEFFEDVHAIDMSNSSGEKTWYKVADNDSPKPCGRAAHNIVAIGDSFYIFGGFDRKGNTLSDFWQFDTSDLSWSQINYAGKVPTRMDFAMCTVTKGNKTDILIHGGFNADCVFYDAFIVFSPKGKSQE